MPGRNRSGILAAYKPAPVMYNAPMVRRLVSEPFSNESEIPFSMRKCIIGKADISPRATKIAALKTLKAKKKIFVAVYLIFKHDFFLVYFYTYM